MHAERSSRLQAIPEHATIAAVAFCCHGFPLDSVQNQLAAWQAAKRDKGASPMQTTWSCISPATAAATGRATACQISAAVRRRNRDQVLRCVAPPPGPPLLFAGMDWEKEGPEPSVAGFSVSSCHPWKESSRTSECRSLPSYRGFSCVLGLGALHGIADRPVQTVSLSLKLLSCCFINLELTAEADCIRSFALCGHGAGGPCMDSHSFDIETASTARSVCGP